MRQCDLQNLVHIFNEVYGELLFDVGWDVGKILLIVLGKDERPNSSPMSRQQFLFDPSDRQYLSPQRDLSRHGNITSHRDVSESTHQRGRHRDTGGRTIFWDRSLGNVYVEVKPTVEIFGNSEPLRPRAHVTHCGLS